MKVTDGRKRGWFWAQNEIFNTWGKYLKPNGIAVYLCLCRHANQDYKAWPGYGTIRDECGMSRRTAIRTIKQLIDFGLITCVPREKDDGSDNSNLYTILDISKIPLPHLVKHNPKKNNLKSNSSVTESLRGSVTESLGWCQTDTTPSVTESPEGNPLKETQLKETNLRNITTTTTSELSTGKSLEKSSSQEEQKKPTTTSSVTVESKLDDDSGSLIFDFALKDFSPEQQRRVFNLLKDIPTVEDKQLVLDEFNSAYQQGTIKSPWRYLSTLVRKYQSNEFTATSELPEQRTQVQAEANLNLPSFEEAFYEATNGRGRFHYQPNEYWKWASQTHLAVYHAVKNIPDLFHFDHLPEKQARYLFKTAWQQVITQLRAGQSLKPIPTVTKHDPEPIPKTADRTGKGYAKFKRFLEQMNKEKRT